MAPSAGRRGQHAAVSTRLCGLLLCARQGINPGTTVSYWTRISLLASLLIWAVGCQTVPPTVNLYSFNQAGHLICNATIHKAKIKTKTIHFLVRSKYALFLKIKIHKPDGHSKLSGSLIGCHCWSGHAPVSSVNHPRCAH